MSPNIVLDFTEENALRQVRVVTRQTTAEELLRVRDGWSRCKSGSGSRSLSEQEAPRVRL